MIAIGELRDLETISLALTAAETGHLVLATLHTGGTIRTVDRIVGSFPSNQQAQVRTMLSESLRGVVSQRLVRRADGQGRVAALEILLGSRGVANLIREAKTFQIRSILQTGASHGMRLLDVSLAQLVREGVVTREAALLHADDPKISRRRHQLTARIATMGRLHELLQKTRESGGSDLHLGSGIAARARIHGTLELLAGETALSSEELGSVLAEGVSAAQWREFLETGDLDFAMAVPGVARFRGNYFRQERGPAAVFRTIPEKIATIEELGLPAVLGRLAELRGGLVLITGPTGSGKSTTLAAIIDRINRSSARHIVTIEEPVEFVHRNARSVFSQREVGVDSVSFAAALRAAIRQDADVVLVGEMRDLETIALALKAAEMGALVFGTLHTGSAAKTIDRLIDVFPADEQPQARLSLAESLAAIVAQLLLPRADGEGRVAVQEILLKTPALPNLIREGNTPMLYNVMQAGRSEGMQLLDDALQELVATKVVSARDAYLKAQDKSRFEPLLEKE